MSFSNVKLIMAREIRDQMRDRRTLFMIVVLPILLYPLLGTSFLQLAQFMQEQPTKVLIVGMQDLNDLPPLFENQQFSGNLFSNPDRARLLELTFSSNEPKQKKSEKTDQHENAKQLVQSGQYDAALYIPPDFAQRLTHFRQTIEDRHNNSEGKASSSSGKNSSPMPKPEIIYSTANEKSQIAFARLSEVIRQWTDLIGKENLEAGGIPVDAIRPFTAESADVASDSGFRGSAIWAKILPMLLLLWALTGAFYPAIDLCAGEKERGTLETLLSSPAQRSEIVLGKLLTIMLFSVVTVILNLLSVGVSIWVALGHLKVLGPPPMLSAVWLLAALLPISALFSALCLALAVFAKSTKEGQYYLMPLLLITMPLVILPMSPGMELNFGNSLIPVTGVMLLLRSLLEGHYMLALQYSPVVIGVTLISCVIAIRWAIDQFNSESVLFRESERLDIGLWLMSLLRERKATPAVASAIFCCIVIIFIKFFMSFAIAVPSDQSSFVAFAKMALITQLVVILTPVLLMTIVLTKSPRETLLIKKCHVLAIPAAFLLAVFLHPLSNLLQSVVMKIYPVSEGAMSAMQELTLMFNNANIWLLILVLALAPAICEELTFRGFILSGFRHIGHKWRAIVLSAFFFGVIHGILQQSMIACLVGLILGYIAVQTGSIWPCMVFHFTHNSLAVLNTRITPSLFENVRGLGSFIIPIEHGGCTFSVSMIIFSSLASILLLVWFGLLPYQKSPEEELQQAIANGELPDTKDQDISTSLASLFE